MGQRGVWVGILGGCGQQVGHFGAFLASDQSVCSRV